MVATASMRTIGCWHIAQDSSVEDCHSWNMECWESQLIWRFSTGLSCAPVRRSCRICAWVGRGPRLTGAGVEGRERDGLIGPKVGPVGRNATFRGTVLGNMTECQEPILRVCADEGGRMATVLHDEPSVGGMARKGAGGGARCRIARAWFWQAAGASWAAGETW